MSTLPPPFQALIAETLTATAVNQIVAIGALDCPTSTVSVRQLTLEQALSEAGQHAKTDLALARLESRLSSTQARQLIAVMRDLMARQVLVFVPENLLDDTTLTGLGLTRQARFMEAEELWQAWSYDIRTYKAVPDWLNPRFWANPENWNKYRW